MEGAFISTGRSRRRRSGTGAARARILINGGVVVVVETEALEALELEGAKAVVKPRLSPSRRR